MSPEAAGRPPLWRDLRVLRAAFQVVFAAVMLATLWYLARNLGENMRASNLSTGWGFLDQPTGVDIRGSDFLPHQPVRDALLIGVVNTVRVSAVGIALATVLGLLVGVARLSVNWLVRRAAAAYVETFRNLPVLLVIVFVYTAIIRELPEITQAPDWFGLVVPSNRRIAVPWWNTGPAAGPFLALSGVALAVAALVIRWRTRISESTGAPHHRVLWGLGAFTAIAAIAYVALGAPLTATLPVRAGRRITGGVSLGPEYTALLLGLSIYTASHIAEIVRGSILAVPRGQTEAATALALPGFQQMRYVILPQALRIAVPSIANQYLSLTKNSSLAVAIGYFEITRITGQAIANGRPAPQLIATLMAAYLALSLTISVLANVVNRRLALPEH